MLLQHPKVVAVGETGLDSVRQHATLVEQRRLFDAQLGLASELGLPVVVHSREAADETAEALAPFSGTVILHCFSSPDLLAAALERGYYVSFAGNVTYPKADELRRAAQAVPGDRLLVETDAPYLAPQPVRGRRNEPANLVHTVAALAEARGEDERALAESTHANAATAFGL
jgi:TatD DNase family protein